MCNMTVDHDDEPDDDLLASLATLPTCDVSQRRSRQLRSRCHALLRAEPPVEKPSGPVNWSPLRRVIVPALGAAWCLTYLLEIIRCTAAIYGHVGIR